MLPALLALALAGAPQDSAHLVVVATTDLRGQVVGWDYVADAPAAGGLARVAAVVDSLRARYPGQVVVVDGGNALEGSPFASYFARVAPRDPHPVVEALALAGYDVGTPGDRDFDPGISALRRAVAGASFPFVSANIIHNASDTSLYAPFAVLRRSGVRVAVVGLTAAAALPVGASGERAAGGVRIAPVRDVAAGVLERARQQADIVIALARAGLEYGPEGRALRVALTGGSGSGRPDLVVAGPAERGRDTIVGEVPFVQPSPEGMAIAVVHIWLGRDRGAWQRRRTQIDFVAAGRVAPAERVLSRLAAEQAVVRAWARERVGWAVAEFPAAGARAGATALVDVVNRAQRDRTGAELAATAVDDAALGFRRGEIRRADLLALHPLDDTLVAVRISGAELKAYLEHAARYFRVDALGRVSLNDSVPAADFDIVSGAEYEIDLHAPVGSRIGSLAVRGRRVQPADSFTLAVSGRRRAGAGGYTMLATAPVVYSRGEYVRDVLSEELRRRESIDPADFAERHWRIVPAAATAAVRALFGLADTASVRPPTRDSTLLRLIATGDLHGRFDLIPKLKTVMDSLAVECGCAVVRLGAGDIVPSGSVATAVASVASVQLLGGAGIAAMVPGERELAWPADTLRRRVAVAGYPWLAANLFEAASRRRPAWVEPYRIVTAGGRRIAVIGYVGAAVSASVGAERAQAYHWGEGTLALKAVLDEIRAARPDLTILLAHAAPDELETLVRMMPRGSVDVVVTGHHGDGSVTSIQGLPVIQAGPDGASVATADVVRLAAGGSEIRSRIVPVSGDARPDTSLALVAARFQRRVDSAAASPVATMKLPIDRGDPRLGRMVAEARRSVLRADVGVVSDDELRAGISAGPIVYRDVLRVQPLGRALVLVTATGEQLRAALEQMVQSEQPSSHISGIQVRYDPKRPAGRRVRQVRLPDGAALDRRREYRVALDETMLRSAAGKTALGGAPAARSDLLDVDALFLYLRRLSQPVEVPDRPGFLPTEP